MLKPMIIMLAALLMVFGGIFAWNAIQVYETEKYLAALEPALVSVSAEKAAWETWRFHLSSVGPLKAVHDNSLDLKSHIHFMTQV